MNQTVLTAFVQRLGILQPGAKCVGNDRRLSAIAQIQLIGLDYPKLKILLQNAEQLHDKKQALFASKKIRIIAGGGGRKPKLSIKEQIILILVYLRHLMTFQLLGIQFGVSESTANDPFNYWLLILKELLPSSLIEQVSRFFGDV